MCTKCTETEWECRICGIIKPIEEFNWQTGRKYRRRDCKLCQALGNRARRNGTTYEIELEREIEKQKIEQERKELDAQGLRKCTCEFECNQIRPIEEFEFRRGKYTNLLKECKKRRYRGYYKKNPEPAKDNGARWKRENPEKVKEQNRSWRQNNRERANQIASDRRKLVGKGYRKNKTVIALCERQKEICPLCNQPLHEDPLDSRHHIDHIYPVCKAKEDGWTKEQINHIDNLQIVHATCNLRKADKVDYKHLFEEAD